MIDPAVGLTEIAPVGAQVGPDRPLAVVHARDRGRRRRGRRRAAGGDHGRRRGAAASARSIAREDRVIPKAELHVHLEGTAPPALIRRLAAAQRHDRPRGRVRDRGRSSPGRTSCDFLRTYDLAASVIRTPEDYRDVTFEYLVELRGRGRAVRRGDRLARPRRRGRALRRRPLRRHRPGDRRRARGARHRGADRDRRRAQPRRRGGRGDRPPPRRRPASVRGRLQPRRRRGRRGRRACSRAPTRSPPAPGLGCTVHAGEHAGPESVRAALELPITRISHGVRAIEDPALVAELAERGIVLEVCPSSNVSLGRLPDLRGPSTRCAPGGRGAGHTRL